MTDHWNDIAEQKNIEDLKITEIYNRYMVFSTTI